MRIHSLLSPKCEVRRSGLSGQGVFAKEHLVAGELIAVWGGKVYTTEEIRTLAGFAPQFETHPVTLCHRYYLGSENFFELEDAEFFNHSCEANIGVKGQVVVAARRDVAAGEELVFNYETTESPILRPFQCHCGSQYCRGTIDGNAWKDPAFVARNRGYLSWYIQTLIDEREDATARFR